MTVLRVICMSSPDKSVDTSNEWQKFMQSGTSGSGHPSYWGRQIEDTNLVWIVCEWPTAEDHCDFPGFTSAEDAIKAALPSVKMLAMYHIPSLQPASLAALEAPMTWISTGFFSKGEQGAYDPVKSLESATEDAKRQANFEAVVREFSRQCIICGDAGRPRGIASGWTLEDDVEFTKSVGPKKADASAGDKEDEVDAQALQGKGKGFVSFLGWDSLDAHHAFSKTDVVKENGPKMMQAGAEGWMNAHVAFQKVMP